MKLTPLHLSLCRVPAFSIQDELANVWPALKEKISTASPSFYAQIKTIEAHQIGHLPDKIQFTIWKYFNRSKYRATPFANFASYSLVPIRNEATEIQIEAKMLSHKFINWLEKDKLFTNTKTMFSTSKLFYCNASVYFTATEIRYLCFNEGAFELKSIEIFPELKDVLNFCRKKRSKTALFEFMKMEHQLNKQQCINLIFQLINLQLLLTNNNANITGEDYFNRLKLLVNKENENYILAERTLNKGSLNYSNTEEIAEALNFLAQQLPISQNKDLQNFKINFLKKFEHQEVSLAVIMDPELGVGYGNLAQYEQVDPLIEQLMQTTNKADEPQSIPYTALHRFLINGLITNKPIELEKLNTIPQTNNLVPNTLSVICQFYKNQSVITHAGGCTANALLGRFTLGNKELESFCREISEAEQNANPNVLFFDILYQAEAKIDNVNRRKNCYKYELPILTWSCLDNPLDFEDVMVSLQNDEIILRSKKLAKRLIPRLASAYNYSRSDLAVYRFLCDLQHQSVQSNVSFNFQNYLPGLQHYPQVGYKNVILSPAQWLLPKSLYQQKNKEAKENIKDLQSWFKQKNIDFLIKTGLSDQTLCFNPIIQEDLNALLNYCKQQDDRPIYLSEALIDEETKVTDQHGKKYNAEFVINFSHNKQIYKEVLQPSVLKIMQTFFLPTSEWLYFEIFVHPSKSNDLLCLQINELLKAHKNDITKWFFIRYNEHGKHLRLRLLVKESIKRSCIIDHLNRLFTLPLANGLVNDLALKTYRREIARYSVSNINNVEQFFYLDSKQVLSFLAKRPNKNECYQQTIFFITRISTVFFPSPNDQLAFIKQMTQSFSAEFKIKQEGFKKINQAYAQLKNDEEQQFGFKQLENQAHVIYLHCNAKEKAKMLTDLIHMHINRVFNDHQRLHEAICYQFIYKRLLTAHAQLNAQGERQASA